MRQRQPAILGLIGFTVLIFDAKTAITAARGAMELCLYTVIPSLLPFIFLSTLLTPALHGFGSGLLRPLGKLCHVSKGAEPMMLIGFLGGYPVGAQAIAQSWKEGYLSQTAARRMLGFCSNAGPAFIFGMGISLFTHQKTCWALWLIHIVSAIITGLVLPGRESDPQRCQKPDATGMVQALEKTVKAMALICGWVIVFRIILAFVSKWILWPLPVHLQILICGLFELTNGAISLQQLACQGQRMLYMSLFLGFGGLCVLGQTASVTQGLGMGYYFPGKLLQGLISFSITYLYQFLVLPPAHSYRIPNRLFIFIIASMILYALLLNWKITVAFRAKMLYNKKNHLRKERLYVIQSKAS